MKNATKNARDWRVFWLVCEVLTLLQTEQSIQNTKFSAAIPCAITYKSRGKFKKMVILLNTISPSVAK